jgi:hypothetical protein
MAALPAVASGAEAARVSTRLSAQSSVQMLNAREAGT